MDLNTLSKIEFGKGTTENSSENPEDLPVSERSAFGRTPASKSELRSVPSLAGHADQTPAKHSTEKERSQFLLQRSFILDPWRAIATVIGFPVEQLWSAEEEILDMIERVVIRGKGWTKKDKLRSIRDRIPISPRKLSKHGKKLSPRTYERSIKRLMRLGLLKHESTGTDQIRVFSPGWWPAESPADAVDIWKQADNALHSLKKSLSHSRTDDSQMANSSRSPVAPPVPGIPPLTGMNDNPLSDERCDKSPYVHGRRKPTRRKESLEE